MKISKCAWTIALCFVLALSLEACNHPSSDEEASSTVSSIIQCSDEIAVSSTLDPGDGLIGSLSYIINLEEIHLIGGQPIKDKVVVNTWGDNNPRMVGFSPGGGWLAYKTGSPFDGMPQTIHLISSDGKATSTTPLTNEIVTVEPGSYSGSWGDILWVNDDTVMVWILEVLEEYHRHVIGLLNPFTGEWQQALLEGLDREPNGPVFLSPDKTRVLYISQVGGLPKAKLWDVEQQEELWDSANDTIGIDFAFADQGWAGAVAWSLDSTSVAFTMVEKRNEHNRPDIAAQGIYLLDRNGRGGRFITDFFSRYAGRNFTTQGLSWSPDGRYLAMTVLLGPPDSTGPSKPERRLYLYDLANDALIDMCWIGRQSPVANSSTGALVWSPDSKFIAYSGSLPNPSNESKEETPALFVINIFTGEVTVLLEEVVTLGGWSSKFTP